MGGPQPGQEEALADAHIAGLEGDRAGDAGEFGGDCVQPGTDLVGITGAFQYCDDQVQVAADGVEQLAAAAEGVVLAAADGGDLLQPVDNAGTNPLGPGGGRFDRDRVE